MIDENQMSDNNKLGYDNRIGVARAKPSSRNNNLEQDVSIVIQEQIARMIFFAEKTNLHGKSILDLGCGTGYNVEYAVSKLGAKTGMGVDIAESVIAFAKKKYPTHKYLVADLRDPTLDLGLESWDHVICCEVFEHVQMPSVLLDTLSKHLCKDGVGFISTPNKPVFSLGYEPSPKNKTHIKEYCLDEFREMLEAKFSQVNIWGQRFKNQKLFQRHVTITKRDIAFHRIFGGLFWNFYLRQVWRFITLVSVKRFLGKGLAYNHSDMEFVQPVSEDSIWLNAIVRK